MAKEDIVSVPDKRLRQRSRRVGVIDEETKSIIKKMSAATLDWEAGRQSEVGVALAAVQIGILERIIIIRTHPEDRKNTDFEVLINPEITKKEGQPVTEPEGCLSIPDTYGLVPRYPRIRVSAVGIDGRPIRLKVDGFLARIIQHEVDHLHGKLFVDHVEDNSFYKIHDNGKLEPLQTKQINEARILWNSRV